MTEEEKLVLKIEETELRGMLKSVLGVLDTIIEVQREITKRIEALELAMPGRVPLPRNTK